MKILHVADYLPGLHKSAGGAEYVTQRVIDEQVAAGIEVEVATLGMDFPDQPLPWRHHEMRHLDRWAPRLAYAVKQLYFPADPLAAKDLAAAIEKSRPDVVHYHNLHYAGLSVVSQAGARGIPSVWSVYDYWLFCPAFMLLTNRDALCRRGHGGHCVDCIGTRRMRALKPLKRILFATRPSAFATPVAAVDRFIVLSSASAELLQSQGIAADRIKVIPQYLWQEAASTPRVRPPVPGRLLYVGWMEHRKGLHVIIEAMARLADEFSELHLDVLGLPANAAYEAQIRQLVNKHGIAERVRFRGKIGRNQLIDELQNAYLVTIPEQWENMSPVILTEAMAAGACVLASRVGGIRHFVAEQQSGLLAERDDAQEYADRMRWAMHNPESIRAMGIAAAERAAQLFEPRTITAATLDLYQSLMKERPARGVRHA